MLNQSHQVSKFSKKLKKEERLNKSLWFRKKLKKNKMLNKSSVEEIQHEIKEKHKETGVISEKIVDCTESGDLEDDTSDSCLKSRSRL